MSLFWLSPEVSTRSRSLLRSCSSSTLCFRVLGRRTSTRSLSRTVGASAPGVAYARRCVRRCRWSRPRARVLGSEFVVRLSPIHFLGSPAQSGVTSDGVSDHPDSGADPPSNGGSGHPLFTSNGYSPPGSGADPPFDGESATSDGYSESPPNGYSARRPAVDVLPPKGGAVSPSADRFRSSVSRRREQSGHLLPESRTQAVASAAVAGVDPELACWTRAHRRLSRIDHHDQLRVMTSASQRSTVAPGVAGVGAATRLT